MKEENGNNKVEDKTENYYIEFEVAGMIKSKVSPKTLTDKIMDSTDLEVNIMFPDGSVHKVTLCHVNKVEVEEVE